jgi:hypothetical protein
MLSMLLKLLALIKNGASSFEIRRMHRFIKGFADAL